MLFSFFEKKIDSYPLENEILTIPPKNLFGFFQYYTRGLWFYFISLAILTALIAIIEITLFGFMGKLVDWLSTKNRATFLQEEQMSLLLISLLLVIVLPLVVLLQSLFLHQTLMGNFPMRVRWLTHRFLLQHSLGFFANEFAGRLSTKVMQTALAVRDSLIKFLDVMVYIIVYFISMITLLATLESRFIVPILVWFFSYIGLLVFFIPRFSKTSERQADARAVMSGRIADSYTNISTIKLFSHSKREASYVKESMQNFMKTVHPQMRLGSWNTISIWFLNLSLILSLTGMSIFYWLQNNIQLGAVAVSLSLAFRMNGMAHWIVWEVSSLFENLGTVRDGMQTLTTPITIQDVPAPKILHAKTGEIEFKNVCFGYNEKLIFSNLNFVIRPGEKIGVVGRSGAGKTTLVNLLLRFYDLNSGEICIDKQNIAEVSQESLRANIGMVTQEPSLLHRSVRENIIFAKPECTEEELHLAIQKAAALEFIEGLRDYKGNLGLYAEVGERGVKLSGGQRQRIAIARVILKNAPILILDEATSALDSEIENIIQGSLTTIMKDKTVIAIAHRLSTIMAMDRLLVLDHGEIVEMGTHKELMSKKGIYALLWERQSGNFLGVD